MTPPKLSQKEWDLLCQQCGRCCLKTYAGPQGEVIRTTIACFCLDVTTKRCTQFANRVDHVPQCQRLSPTNIPYWMPSTCAYVRWKQGKDPVALNVIEERYPWDNVVSEMELMEFKLADYILCIEGSSDETDSQ